MNRTIRWLLALTIAVLAFAVLVVVFWRIARPRITEDQVRQSVYMTLVREAPASFLVTGSLDATATTSVSSTRLLFPQSLRLSLGTTSTTVRVPGRISYGFDLRGFRPEMVHLTEDGAIEVEVPALQVYAVEPDLRRLEVETDRGWLRTEASEERVETQALAILRGSFHRQGVQHLQQSMQPKVNSARALQQMIEPVLAGLGLDDPHLRFVLGGGVTIESVPGARRLETREGAGAPIPDSAAPR